MRGKLTRQRVVAEAFRITPADAGKTIQRSIKKPPEQDHPRGCGENINPSYSGSSSPGSPPRMRGKRDWDSAKVSFKRITPADAGKTRTIAAVKNLCQDHPRGCGENNAHAVDIVNQSGSPPRMRGKRK